MTKTLSRIFSPPFGWGHGEGWAAGGGWWTTARRRITKPCEVCYGRGFVGGRWNGKRMNCDEGLSRWRVREKGGPNYFTDIEGFEGPRIYSEDCLASERGLRSRIVSRTELTIHYYGAIDELLIFDWSALCDEDSFFQIPHRRVRGEIFVDLVLAVEWSNDVLSIRGRGGTCRGHGD
jgi:hypothetical protein